MQKVKPDVPSSSCFTSTQGLGGGGSKNARARDGRRPGIGFLLGMDYQMQENLVGMDVRKQSFAAGQVPLRKRRGGQRSDASSPGAILQRQGLILRATGCRPTSAVK
ncbi:unnamed protein product [Rangifer tarandus platyrhynchus]|uniref:Uncharacterized protein n=1 Tax=Rangifer tarandus platyrhynchus TaxID=3082113 RepID=A0AC59ZH50_RANTA